MTLDQRARTAATWLRQEVTTIAAPVPGTVLRRARRRRRRSTALAAVGLLVVGGLGWRALASDDPTTTSVAAGEEGAPGWSRILKADAGLADSSLYAVASDGDEAVLVGASRAGDWWGSAIWWTDDGRSWREAEHPEVSGVVWAVGLHDDVALAFGTEGDREEPYTANFVWRSDDGGRTWRDLEIGTDAFGPPAPEMGRPSATQVVFHDGWWVAAGGSSTGYAGIWVSRTGEAWEQVLESDEAGGVTLTELADGDLLAYWTTVGWRTADPTEWGASFAIDAPEDLYPASIAPGATVAAARGFENQADSAVLRSDDEGRSWRRDEAFDEAFPGVDLATVARFGTTSVLGGFDAQGSPGAWVSIDDGPWTEIPVALRRPVGGMLSLVAEVDGQIVVLGGAPELNRFYVFRP